MGGAVAASFEPSSLITVTCKSSHNLNHQRSYVCRIRGSRWCDGIFDAERWLRTARTTKAWKWVKACYPKKQASCTARLGRLARNASAETSAKDDNVLHFKWHAFTVQAAVIQANQRDAAVVRTAEEWPPLNRCAERRASLNVHRRLACCRCASRAPGDETDGPLHARVNVVSGWRRHAAEVRLEPDALDHALLAAVAQREGPLNEAFPQGGLAHDQGAAVVVQRRGEELSAAGGAPVDEDDQRLGEHQARQLVRTEAVERDHLRTQAVHAESMGIRRCRRRRRRRATVAVWLRAVGRHVAHDRERGGRQRRRDREGRVRCEKAGRVERVRDDRARLRQEERGLNRARGNNDLKSHSKRCWSAERLLHFASQLDKNKAQHGDDSSKVKASVV
eukprot:6203383-Pleurochrysis_carterae.AAC.7